MTPEIRRIGMSRPQYDLVSSTYKFPAMVAGFGAGKTEALVNRTIALKLKFKELNSAYYMPTFDLVRMIAWPRFEEKFELYKIRAKLNRSFYRYEVNGGGNIFFRTMDDPSRIIGYEVADSAIDELDTLATENARGVWNKVVARNRQKKPTGFTNTIAVGTTPEGFRFVYEKWKKDEKALEKGYQLIKASTRSNAKNLPEDYIQTLLDTYPANLIAAYIEGDFVNLTSGSVYSDFDRKKNGTDATEAANEILHIGMDFNVNNMACVVFVERKGNPYAVGEIVKQLDTPAMIIALKRRFPNHRICVYPDASGSARKSNNASQSDISLLNDAKFTVFANHSNPAVKDRVLSMNAMININGKRRLLVNASKCPSFVETLEKQVYDKHGEPDKTTGLDHSGDAGGYFICFRYPVVRKTSQRATISGI